MRRRSLWSPPEWGALILAVAAIAVMVGHLVDQALRAALT